MTRPNVVAGMLLAVLAANLLWLSYSRGITQDEVIHIPAGQYQLRQRDFRMNNVTPPAVKTLSALPTILSGSRPVLPRFPQDPNVAHEARDYQIAREFFTANNDRFRAIVFTARVGAVILTILLGFMVFVFARQLFGLRAALLALVLFILEPNILAHGHIVHADVIAGLALVLFCYVLVNYWRRSSVKWTLLLGVATGFALIAKFTLVALAGVFFVALVVRWGGSRKLLARNMLAKCGAILLCLLIVNAAYFFEPRRPVDPAHLADMRGPAASLARFLPRPFVRAIGVLLPSDFIQGFFRLSRINQNGHEAFLLGKYSITGWWYYFPVAFVLKATLPFLLLTLAAGIWAVARLFGDKRWPLVPLLAALAFYSSLLATSRINIGVRHLLPLFPFLLIVCAAFLDWLIIKRRKFGIVFASLLIGAMGFEAVRSWPTYMSYMNQLTSAHPRWSYLGDSNIEWGQETAELGAYLNARGVKRIRGAMLCGEVALPRYGVEYVNLLSEDRDQAPPTEFIALGANFLNGSLIPGNREWFQSYRDRKPEAVFGDSIYLYRFEGQPSTSK